MRQEPFMVSSGGTDALITAKEVTFPGSVSSWKVFPHCGPTSYAPNTWSFPAERAAGGNGSSVTNGDAGKKVLVTGKLKSGTKGGGPGLPAGRVWFMGSFARCCPRREWRALYTTSFSRPCWRPSPTSWGGLRPMGVRWADDRRFESLVGFGYCSPHKGLAVICQNATPLVLVKPALLDWGQRLGGMALCAVGLDPLSPVEYV